MQKREAKFTTFFRHWLKANPLISGAFELKQTLDLSFPFAGVEDHQIDALLAAKHAPSGFLYKAPDDSRGTKPFDLFYLRNSAAFVVIRYRTSFYLIDIDTFILERDRSKRKSLTRQRADDICTYSGTIHSRVLR